MPKMTTPQSIAWVKPLEPPPDLVEPVIYAQYVNRVQFEDRKGHGFLRYIQKPWLPNDIIDGHRVTSVECKMVKDVTEAEAEAAGFRAWKYYGVDISVLKDFKERWEGDHPQHPFDSSYCWLVRGELVKKEK